MPETSRRRVGAGVVAALGLWCSLAASCRAEPIILQGDAWGGSGSTSSMGSGGSAGSGGSGGGSSSSTGGGDVCGENATCEHIPMHPFDYTRYMLLAVRPKDQPPPDCPDRAPSVWRDAYTNLVQPVCPLCTCQPPKGSCELPTKMRAYYTNVCSGIDESFDAPMGWDGSCTPANPIPGDPSCSGNNCIQGLYLDALLVKDPACEAGTPTPMQPVPAQWGKAVRACQRTYQDCGPDHFCVPTPPPGFMACLAGQNGERVDCAVKSPDYPNPVYVYDNFKDMTTCSSCTCGAPMGSKCSTSISVYTTASDCTGPQLMAPIDSTQPSWCYPLGLGTGLLSKSAALPTYTPGTCAAMGGQLSGDAKPDEAGLTTFCCK